MISKARVHWLVAVAMVTACLDVGWCQPKETKTEIIEWLLDPCYSGLLPVENVKAITGNAARCAVICSNRKSCASFFTHFSNCYLFNIVYVTKDRLKKAKNANYYRIKCEQCPVKKCYYKSREHDLCFALRDGTADYKESSVMCEKENGRLINLRTKASNKWMAKVIGKNLEGPEFRKNATDLLIATPNSGITANNYTKESFPRSRNVSPTPVCNGTDAANYFEGSGASDNFRGDFSRWWSGEVHEIHSILAHCPSSCLPAFTTYRMSWDILFQDRYRVSGLAPYEHVRDTDQICAVQPTTLALGSTQRFDCAGPVYGRMLQQMSGNQASDPALPRCSFEAYGRKNGKPYAFLGAVKDPAEGPFDFCWMPDNVKVADKNDTVNGFWIPDRIMIPCAKKRCLVLSYAGWFPDLCQGRPMKTTICEYVGLETKLDSCVTREYLDT